MQKLENVLEQISSSKFMKLHTLPIILGLLCNYLSLPCLTQEICPISEQEKQKFCAIYRDISKAYLSQKVISTAPIQYFQLSIPEQHVRLDVMDTFDRQVIVGSTIGHLTIVTTRDTFELLLVSKKTIDENSDDSWKNYFKDLRPRYDLPARNQYSYANGAELLPKYPELAKGLLQHMGIKLPNSYQIHFLDFGIESREQYEIRWRPMADNYEYNDFKPFCSPEIIVRVDPLYRSFSIARTPEIPPPVSKEIQIRQTDAVKKAIDLFSAIQKTNQYKAMFPEGFVFAEISMPQLKVVIPNNLLNSDNNSTSIKPAAETKLAWVLKIKTRPGGEELHKKIMRPPTVAIYIDASSGECIGGDLKYELEQ
jgi:hypothetical protein